MAQAASITTAIRQLMSRVRLPKSTSPVRLAHNEFIAALAANVLWMASPRRLRPVSCKRQLQR
jgi:hypothetical protein